MLHSTSSTLPSSSQYRLSSNLASTSNPGLGDVNNAIAQCVVGALWPLDLEGTLGGQSRIRDMVRGGKGGGGESEHARGGRGGSRTTRMCVGGELEHAHVWRGGVRARTCVWGGSRSARTCVVGVGARACVTTFAGGGQLASLVPAMS